MSLHTKCRYIIEHIIEYVIRYIIGYIITTNILYISYNLNLYVMITKNINIIKYNLFRTFDVVSTVIIFFLLHQNVINTHYIE